MLQTKLQFMFVYKCNKNSNTKNFDLFIVTPLVN